MNDALQRKSLWVGLAWLTYFACPGPELLFNGASPAHSLFANSEWQACRRILLRYVDDNIGNRIFIDNSDQYELQISFTPHQTDNLIRVCRSLTADGLKPK